MAILEPARGQAGHISEISSEHSQHASGHPGAVPCRPEPPIQTLSMRFFSGTDLRCFRGLLVLAGPALEWSQGL